VLAIAGELAAGCAQGGSNNPGEIAEPQPSVERVSVSQALNSHR